MGNTLNLSLLKALPNTINIQGKKIQNFLVFVAGELVLMLQRFWFLDIKCYIAKIVASSDLGRWKTVNSPLPSYMQTEIILLVL